MNNRTIPITIRPYNPKNDENWAYSLWNKTVGEEWPLDHQTFQNITVKNPQYQHGDHLVASLDGKTVGFIASQTRVDEAAQRNRGEIMVILVDPGHQRSGVGTALLFQTIANFKAKALTDIQLGGGGTTYFWPGVPCNLPHANKFFQKHGFEFTEKSIDMVLNLRTYKTPDWVHDRIRVTGITVEKLSNNDVPQLLAFEKENFPEWYMYYSEKVDSKAFDEILTAKVNNEEIAGSVLLTTPASPNARGSFVWKKILGNTMGDFGALGVSKKHQKKGIGTALAAKSCALLKESGAHTCFIGWTWLEEWYGKLGFTVWREYNMSWMKL